MPQRNEAAAVLDEFEDLLASAVKYRQVSDVPIGAFLSGTGFLYLCAVSKQNTNPVNTFTIGFDVEGYDESAYAAPGSAKYYIRIIKTHLTEKALLRL